MEAKILIRKDGKYCKMIPNGLLWKKEIGNLNSDKKIIKEMGIGNFVPEYWRMVDAGYVDQTNVFSRQDYDFSNIEKEAVSLIKNLVNSTKEHMEDYNNDYLSSGQILNAETILEQMKRIVNSEPYYTAKNNFSEKMRELYGCLFKKNCKEILKTINSEEKLKEVFEKELEDFAIAKSTNAAFGKLPKMYKCSDEEKLKVEKELDFECLELFKADTGKSFENSNLLFHASPTYNWLSILSYGLDKDRKMIHGNSFGKGIYLSNTYNYCSWYTNSQKGFSNLVGIFEVNKDGLARDYQWGKVVEDNSAVNIKYLSVKR